MKTNHRRKNKPPKNHNPWDEPRCYNCGHRGAARRRKGEKHAAVTAQRRYNHLLTQDDTPRITSTLKAFVQCL